MSGSIFYLQSNDFEIRNNAKGSTLCTRIEGYSLVLYYSTKCEHSAKFLPLFKRLPGTVGGCTFALINISTSKDVVKLSKETNSPLTYVPYIVLHINGEPFMRYDGPPEIDALQRFVIEIAQKVTQNNTPKKQVPIQQQRQQQRQQQNQIPAFTIGVPKNTQRENKSYGNFSSTYDSLKSTGSR